MAEGIEGKIVVITGASSGLGAEAARHLVRDGAIVVLGARRLEKLRALVDEMGEDKASAWQTDVTDAKQVQALIDYAVQKHGRVDVLLNNAGQMLHSPLEDRYIDDWNAMIDINIKGVLYGIAAALPQMKTQKSGHIINVASVAGHTIGPSGVVYSATKHAVRVISEGLRQEVKPYGLRTTIISPGAINTELTSHITHPEASKNTQDLFDNVAISADAFARAVLYAIGQPEDVDVNEILFRPTRQVR